MLRSWWKAWFGPAPTLSARMYTRAGCGLCDEAATLLREEGFEVEPVDIDQDSELTERFGLEIPVVEIDGRIRFKGRVNRVLLRRIVQRELKSS